MMRRICLFLFVAVFICVPFTANHETLTEDITTAAPSSTIEPDWNLVAQNTILSQAGGEVSGMVQSTLAEFLQRMAKIAVTGDKGQIEEFVDERMTPDFYKHYGLSWIGAKSSEIAHAHYLEPYVKTRSVNAMLKTSLVMATGMALPMIVEGNFKGKTFAISAASLGLSTAAVKTGVKGLKWVKNLNKAKKAGTLGRVGVRAGRLSRISGWYYVVAEQAVILYVEESLKAYFDFDEERKNLAITVRKLFDAISNPDATEETLEMAVEAYHDGWTHYRNFLYRPLEREEAMFVKRLEKDARSAKLLADNEENIKRIESHPALLQNILKRYGSLEKYNEHLLREDKKKINKRVSNLFRDYNEKREKLLQEVYVDNRRKSTLLSDPRRSRLDLAALEKAVKNVSRNRIQTYDDESEILAALESRLRASGREDSAKILARKLKIVRSLKQADRNLIQGNGSVDTSGL